MAQKMNHVTEIAAGLEFNVSLFAFMSFGGGDDPTIAIPVGPVTFHVRLLSLCAHVGRQVR